MMRNVMIVIVLLLGCVVSADKVSAGDVSVSSLNSWLCSVVSSDSPGDKLHTFPGAPGGSVTTDHGMSKPIVLRRSGRELPRKQIFRWNYLKDDFRLFYTYQKDPRDGEVYGFGLKIVGPTSGESLIFKSIPEARQWLSSLGSIKRGREDGDDQICARGRYDSDNRDYDFKACVDVEMQEVEVDWMDADDLPRSQICGR